MKLRHITLLSAGVLVVLTGCNERGKVVPPSPKHMKKKKKEEILYDFPVLKLSAKASSTALPEIKVKKTPDTSDATNESSSLRFPKMAQKSVETKKIKNQNLNTEVIETKQSVDQNKTSTPALVKEVKKPIKTTQSKSTIQIKRDALKRVIAETKMLQQKDKPKVKRESKKKIIHKRTPRKSSKSSQIPILSSIITPDVSLQDIPILNQILPKPSDTSKGRIRKNTRRQSYKPQSNRNANIPTLDNSPTPAIFNANNNSNGITSFSGGTSARGLDIAKIRVETDNYQTNIVLDSYLWVKYNDIPTETSAVSGTYFFKYEPYNDRIVGHIKGYNTFSALLTKKDDMLKNNPMIKDIYIDRYIGDDGIKFVIELKQKAKVNIIDVEDPGSIIIELYPLKSQEKN